MHLNFLVCHCPLISTEASLRKRHAAIYLKDCSTSLPVSRYLFCPLKFDLTAMTCPSFSPHSQVHNCSLILYDQIGIQLMAEQMENTKIFTQKLYLDLPMSTAMSDYIL